jgi:hypothetical protein
MLAVVDMKKFRLFGFISDVIKELLRTKLFPSESQYVQNMSGYVEH